jgi:hypothetical protein
MLLAVSDLSNRRRVQTIFLNPRINVREAYGLSGSREPYAGHHGARGERRRRGSGALAGTKSLSELIPAVYDVREIFNERRRAILAIAPEHWVATIVRHQRPLVA